MAGANLDPTTLDSLFREHADADHWYVGFSGGPDSTVLLHLLRRWCERNDPAPSLTAIHIHHGLQPEADSWRQHCETMCRSLGVALLCREVSVPAGASPEAAAREARYRAFGELVGEGAVLFLGHHLDDQVETFFLRLMRGAGVEGLAAIAPVRPLGSALVVRPLLETPRVAVENYAAAEGLDFIEDPSNVETVADRNFLRQELLPRFASRWPGYRQTVNRAAGHMRHAMAALDEALGATGSLQSPLGDPGLPLAQLTDCRAELAAARLRSALRLWGCRPPDAVGLEEFLHQLCTAQPDARPRLAWGGHCLERYRDGVYLLPAFTAAATPASLPLEAGEEQVVTGVGRVALRPAEGGFRLAPGEQVELRWRRGGERCRPAGRGGSVDLKKLLQEMAIPPWWRDRLPLLYIDGELLALADLLRCESPRWQAVAEGAGRAWSLHWERPVFAPDD
jgi:tRNA(Ile)-lysidine synthase